ncbi:MAG TPA: alanyl-tRNA editing protein [Anaerolineae bacterium]
MTVRLYRSDSFLWRFTAQVREELTSDGHPAVVLDQTAFYPTAGGQPNDVGCLNGVAVIDVIEREDHEIVHVLATPLKSQEALGEVEPSRRIDLMQQHSGQHVLSAAFVSSADLDTIAVHIGMDESTIDLPTPRLDAGVIERAEDKANQIVFEDRPVIVRELNDGEVAKLPLRKPPKVTGRIRIVEVEGFDWSACGGTHVRSSGQIGLIKITRVEKRGNSTRIYFRCGGRALSDYRVLNQLTATLIEGFRVARSDILPAIDRLRDEAKAARKELADAQNSLLEYEAQELLQARTGSSRPIGVIAQLFDNRDANRLKFMAKRLTAERGVSALLASFSGGRANLCFARSADVQWDAAALLRRALEAMQLQGAKGGGSPEFAQGGAPATDATSLQVALDWAVSQLAR